MRKAAVYCKEFLAGILTETDDGDYTFEYDQKYVAEHPKEFITLTMQVRSKATSKNDYFLFLKA